MDATTQETDLVEQHFLVENDFLLGILKTFENEEPPSPRSICMFFNILLDGIGLTYTTVKEEHIKYAFVNFKWNAELDRYHFIPDQRKLDKMKTFIWEFFDGIMEKYNMLKQKCYYCSTQPITEVFYLLLSWCSLNDLLDRLDPRMKSIDDSGYRFTEPFALINVELLKHTHMLRVAFKEQIYIANRVCQLLYQRTRMALLMPGSHHIIATSLLEIFATNLEIFVCTDYTIVDFFFTAIVAHSFTKFQQLQNLNRTITMFYNFLLQASQDNPDQAHFYKFVDSLLDIKMIEAYMVLLERPMAIMPGSPVVLNYFQFLLSKSKTVECYPTAFMKTLTYVITKIEKDSDRDVAVAAFVGMYRKYGPNDRRMVIELIQFCKILNFQYTFFRHLIKSFFNNTPPIPMIDELTFVIEKCNDDIDRNIAVFMIICIFEFMLDEIDVYQCYTEIFLDKLDTLLEKVKCPAAFERVLTLLDSMNFEVMRNKIRNFKRIQEKLALYFLRKFLLDTELGSAVYAKLLKNFCRCICNENIFENIFEVGDKLMEQFLRTDNEIKSGDKAQSRCPILWLKYCMCIEKLKLLFELKTYKTGHLKEFCHAIADRLFCADHLKDLVHREEGEIAFMGLEALKNALIAMSYFSKEDGAVVFEMLPKLKECLAGFMRHFFQFTFKNASLIKTAFVAFVDLHVVFSEKNEMCNLKMTENEYIILMTVLQKAVFEHPGFPYPCLVDYLQTTFYDTWKIWQRAMVGAFNAMHSCTLSLPVHLVWKIGIYYGTLHNTEFNSLLELLLKLVLEYYFPMYKSIVAKLVLNLYKRGLDMDVIEHTIREYNRIIDENIEDEEDRYQLKLDIIVLILTMTKKIYKLMNKNKQWNRFESLTHVHIFGEGLSIDASILKGILKEGYTLVDLDLTDDERDAVDLFLCEFLQFMETRC